MAATKTEMMYVGSLLVQLTGYLLHVQNILDSGNVILIRGGMYKFAHGIFEFAVDKVETAQSDAFGFHTGIRFCLEAETGIGRIVQDYFRLIWKMVQVVYGLDSGEYSFA